MDNMMEPKNNTTIRKQWARSFFTIWGGQAFSILGSKLVSFALVWWLTIETGSATILATSTIMIYIPQILLGPFVGALVDRWNRRVVMIIADGFVALATLVLAFLFWQEMVQIWHIYALIFLRSLGGAFHFPAMLASTSLMVPEKHLSRVAGINQIMEGGVNIAGPALGALFMGLMPVQGVLAIDVVTAVLAITPLFFIPIPQPKNGKEGQALSPKVVLSDVKEGFRFVFSWRELLLFISLPVILNFLFAPLGSFIPLLVTEHFKGDVWQLGLLESLFGFGMIGGGLLLGVWGGFRRRSVNIMVSIAVMGAATLLVGFTPETGIIFAMILFLIEGMANTFMNGSALSLMQVVIPAEMQGRVFSLLQSVISALSPLGLLFAAPIAENLGIQSWYVVAGAITFALPFVALFVPSILKLEESAPHANLVDGVEGEVVLSTAD